MHLPKIHLGFVFSFIAAIFLVLPFSYAYAAPGEIQATIHREDGEAVQGATVEVSCDGATYASLGTTSATGTVIGDPTAGTTCVNGSTLVFRVSSSTFDTQLYPIIGRTLLPFYTSVDFANASSSISGSTNVFKFGLDTTSTYALSVWNAGGDASVLPFPTGPANYTATSSHLAFDWGNDTPPYPGIGAQDWFVEATKTVTFASGWYEFEIASDDGTLVTLDGVTVINDYFLQAMPGRPYIKRLLVTGGTHTVDVKYYEHTGYTGLYFRFYPIDAPSAPLLEIGSPISSPVNDRLSPTFGVHTDTAGSLSLTGSCTTTTPVAIGVGTSTITLTHLADGTYSDCHATITDPDTNYTDTVDLASFTVAAPPVIHIGTCTELENIGSTSTYYAVDFLLDNDIDCDGVSTAPIAWVNAFIGVFDGGGHRITNFSMDSGDEFVGLFENLNGATIKNLDLASGSVIGLFATGAIAGQATDLSLQNVTSSLDVTASIGFFGTGLGGLVGSLTIQNASTTAWSNINNSGTITGRGVQGGMVGRLIMSNDSTFNLDTLQSNVTVHGVGGATASNSGGLFGTVSMSGTSTLALTNATVSTTVAISNGSAAGGLIGFISTATDGGAISFLVDESTVNGSVTGRNNLGGLIGILSANETGYPSAINIAHTQAAVNVTSSGGADIGGLVGKLVNASAHALSSSVTFDSDTASGNVSGVTNVGGFIGGTDGSGAGIHLSDANGTGGLMIYNSSASGNVTGNNGGGSNPRAGGFIGYLYCQSANPTQYAACILRQNHATGNVSGYQQIGGFVGLSDGDIDIEDSYSTGDVTGAADVGGFMGQLNSEFSYTNVSRVYASSTVTTSGGSPSNIGGLIGSTTSLNSNTNLDHAFSVTSLVDGSGSATNMAWMIGSLSGLTPAHLAYSPRSVTTASCIGNSSGSGICAEKAEATYFYDSSHDPLSDWNFSTIWLASGSAYPTLRGNTVVTYASGASFLNISAVPANSTAVVTWETNEHASTNVFYGTGTPSTAAGRQDYPIRVTQHRASLTGLTSCKVYQFIVTATDAYGTASTSTSGTFQTEGCGGGGNAGGSGGGGGSSRPFTIQTSTDSRSLGEESSSTSTASSTQIATTQVPSPSIIQSLENAPGDANSTSCFSYTFSKDLRFGISGGDVKQLQVFLNSHDTPVTRTGLGSKNQETTYYGQSTKQALIAFQKANNRPTDGIFASTTRALIQSLMPRIACTRQLTFTRNLKIKMRGTDVKALQHFLNANNFLLGPTATESLDYETGYFGSSTKKALELFQAAHKLPATGQLDAATARFIERM